MRIVKTERVKLLELIQDWSLWPRSRAGDLDSTNLARIKQAILAGQCLPPIVADIKSKRIIDGFHRYEVNLKLYGDGAELDVEFREYANEGEMFTDAMELNAKGPLPLSPRDKTHCILVGRRLHIPPIVVQSSLGITDEQYHEWFSKRVATTRSGEKIPISYGAKELSDFSRAERTGRTNPLTAAEERAARNQNGILPAVHIRLLLSMLKTHAFPLTDREVELLTELNAEITRVLARRVAA